MNIIEKYRLKKEDKKQIKIVLNSEFNYKDHDINILKACLNVWSKQNNEYYIPLKFEWMFVDPEQKQKMYFINTNIKELKQMHLDKLVNNKDIQACSYMTSYFDTALFPSYEVKKCA